MRVAKAASSGAWRALLHLDERDRVLLLEGDDRVAELAAGDRQVGIWRPGDRPPEGGWDALLVRLEAGASPAAIAAVVAQALPVLGPSASVQLSIRRSGLPGAIALPGRVAAALAAVGLVAMRAYAGLPIAGRVRYLAPLGGGRQAAGFLSRALPVSGAARVRLVRAAAIAAARIGLLSRLVPSVEWVGTRASGGGREERRDRGQRLVSMARALGLGSLAPGFVGGWRLDGSTHTALLFDASGRLETVAKVATAAGCARLGRERDNLERLAAGGDSRFRHSIPRLLGWHEGSGEAVLFESALGGRGLRPARGRGLALQLRLARDWLAGFRRAAGARAEVPCQELFSRLVLEPFDHYRGRFAVVAEEAEMLAQARDRLAEAGSREWLLAPQHGDLCPSNMLVEHGRLGVIDWEEELAPAPPCFDLFHLASCLVADRGWTAEAAFSRAWLGPAPERDRIREALLEHAAQIGLDRALLGPLLLLFWVDYSLGAAAAGVGGDGGGDIGAWGLVELDGGGCIALRRLARRGGWRYP